MMQDVVEKCHLSGDFFCAYLHQNYLDFYSSIDDVVSASDYLSDADYLTVDWAVSNVATIVLMKLKQILNWW